ncbi:hypothetical protein Zmor_015133 [Zophobas morio]|uniref:Peptidase S1 domain-containing protein n=2 Tax=Zophobas morio TaxID=2755281 RepID=A0AA38IJI2_9CUCU|nr:hypothetical protein Zmor_015133 [Zophobas morio]
MSSTVNVLLVILYFLDATKGASAWPTDNEGRIVGGNDTIVGMFPYVAAINVQTPEGRFFCGGTLYNQDWILTSGHCALNAALFTIHLGSDLLEGEDLNRVSLATSEYIIHPEFNPDTIEHDIALIKLRMPIKYTDYIKPINLPFRWVNPGELLVSIGWGQTSDSDPQLSNKLQHVFLTALTNEDCKESFGNQIAEHMVCAAGNYNEGACIGDTGGPLIDYVSMWRAPRLFGITSFISGNGCESTDPSGYTRVYDYMDWIKNVTNT